MTAWENMQKAEAEAAIHKLVVCLFLNSGLNSFFFHTPFQFPHSQEVRYHLMLVIQQIKLEKKRPYSLERIFNTLRSGSRKTQVVRSTSTVNQDQHISRTIKTAPHLSKNAQMSSLSGCFTCHAFQRCSSRVKFVEFQFSLSTSITSLYS